MDCTKCTLKGCRKSDPCQDKSAEYLADYATEEIQGYTKPASLLIDNGKAGTLNRLEEISEYCKLRGYRKIGVAYCYGMEKEATLLRKYLSDEGFKLSMISCTVDGVKEPQIDPNKVKNVVSCNPLGQANQLYSSGVQFTILMGLCLGHDILLQKHLKMDFTTFVVKDRVLRHNPILGLPGYGLPEDQFLEELPGDFHLLKMEAFEDKLQTQKSPVDYYLLDLRTSEAFMKNGIDGSIQCLMEELSKKYKQLLPDKKKEIIVYCNGGILSIYAVMFLRIKGYQNVRSLAGGFSKYLERRASSK